MARDIDILKLMCTPFITIYNIIGTDPKANLRGRIVGIVVPVASTLIIVGIVIIIVIQRKRG